MLDTTTSTHAVWDVKPHGVACHVGYFAAWGAMLCVIPCRVWSCTLLLGACAKPTRPALRLRAKGLLSLRSSALEPTDAEWDDRTFNLVKHDGIQESLVGPSSTLDSNCVATCR